MSVLRVSSVSALAAILAACASPSAGGGAELYSPERPPTPDVPIAAPQQTQTYAAPEMAAVLAAHAALGARPIETLTVEEARRQPTPADAVRAVMAQRGETAPPPALRSVRDMQIPSAAGPIQARIYVPNIAPADGAPVIAYWHGGGWVIATIDTYDASARALAEQTGAIVVSAHYRQAPEHRFPAAHEDAVAAYRWIAENAASFGGDPARIAVAGESAGANLAANVAIAARDQGLRAPVHQLLVYPVAQGQFDTPSYVENQGAAPLSRSGMQWFFRNAARSPADARDPRIALTSANLARLPPATVIMAELDPLRWEGRTLAIRLEEAGVQTEQRTFDGVTHEFFGMAPLVPQATEAQGLAARRLREAFDR